MLPLLLLVVCAFFTASEMAFIGADWITIRNWANKKRPGAKAALYALHNSDKLLIATLVGTNLTIVGMSITTATIFKETPKITISIITGLLIFIFGEIIPKSIATRFKESLAIILAKPYKFIYIALYPLIFIVYQTSLLAMKLFKIDRPQSFSKFTREDIKIASMRTLPLREYNIISRLLDFRGRKIKEIMIPRNRILAAPEDTPLPLLKQIVKESGYSRIPIYRENIDKITGIVEAKKLVTAKSIKDAYITPTTIDESMPIEELFKRFIYKPFFAIVKDRHGKTVGLVTMEDVLEELFGEIEDEYDRI